MIDKELRNIIEGLPYDFMVQAPANSIYEKVENVFTFDDQFLGEVIHKRALIGLDGELKIVAFFMNVFTNEVVDWYIDTEGSIENHFDSNIRRYQDAKKRWKAYLKRYKK